MTRFIQENLLDKPRRTPMTQSQGRGGFMYYCYVEMAYDNAEITVSKSPEVLRQYVRMNYGRLGQPFSSRKTYNDSMFIKSACSKTENHYISKTGFISDIWLKKGADTPENVLTKVNVEINDKVFSIPRREYLMKLCDEATILIAPKDLKLRKEQEEKESYEAINKIYETR